MVAVPGDVHDLPNKLEKTLPKYYPDKNASPEDHIKIFMLVACLMKFSMNMSFVNFFHTHLKEKLLLGTLVYHCDRLQVGSSLKVVFSEVW